VFVIELYASLSESRVDATLLVDVEAAKTHGDGLVELVLQVLLVHLKEAFPRVRSF